MLDKISSVNGVSGQEARGSVHRPVVSQGINSSTYATSPPGLTASPIGYPVDTNIRDAHGLLEAHIHAKAAGKPIAHVLGGGPGGYVTALVLQKEGFHVFVFEKRSEYTRTNNVELKQEAINMIAHLSPDGSLYQQLRSCGLNAQSFKGQVFDQIQTRTSPGHRFDHWFKPKSPDNLLGPWIPDTALGRAAIANPWRRDSAAINLCSMHDISNNSSLIEEDNDRPLKALDLAWPMGKELRACKPEHYQLPGTVDFGGEDFGSIMLRDLDHTLNHYCTHSVNCGHIDVVAGEASVTPDPLHNRYLTRILLRNEQNYTDIPLGQAPSLIVLADGASSKNVAALFGSKTVSFEQTQELWHQINFSIESPPSVQDGSVLVMGNAPLDAQPDGKRLKYLSNIIVHHNRSVPVINSSTLAVGGSAQAVSVSQVYSYTQQALSIACRAPDGNTLEKARLTPFESDTNLRQIPITLRRAKTMVDKNLCVIGDAAVSGSPVGGYGASLAMSAWPRAVAEYGKAMVARENVHEAVHKRAYQEYCKQAEAIVRVRIGRPAEIMQKLFGYKEVSQSAIASELLFPGQS